MVNSNLFTNIYICIYILAYIKFLNNNPVEEEVPGFEGTISGF